MSKQDDRFDERAGDTTLKGRGKAFPQKLETHVNKLDQTRNLRVFVEHDEE
jgi:hypothetical protein